MRRILFLYGITGVSSSFADATETAYGTRPPSHARSDPPMKETDPTALLEAAQTSLLIPHMAPGRNRRHASVAAQFEKREWVSQGQPS